MQGLGIVLSIMPAIRPRYGGVLVCLREMPGGKGVHACLCPFFPLATSTSLAGRHEVVDLIPNGRNNMVTDENKLEYVQRITHHRMTHSIRAQIESFLEGDERCLVHVSQRLEARCPLIRLSRPLIPAQVDVVVLCVLFLAIS